MKKYIAYWIIKTASKFKWLKHKELWYENEYFFNVFIIFLFYCNSIKTGAVSVIICVPGWTYIEPIQ